MTDVIKGKRGPKEKLTDIQMRELALKVKRKYKNKALSYLLLEKETAISRNTWKRRLESFIQELNTPIVREINNVDGDEIYFPNIESIFELYGDNTDKIINELQDFEILFQLLFKERNELKTKFKTIQKVAERAKEQEEFIAKLKLEKEHYRQLYEQITVASVDSTLRNQMGLKNNLIDFNESVNQNLGLNNLHDYFPAPQQTKEEKKSINMEKLKDKFENLF
ncbi:MULTISPECIES: hypothetical protein [Lysinibacillus]|uniref:Uncharacterized protein n=1 Tax=Lysinibacillus capsici TaxID=2115968 RepID=A0ABY8KI43_9BACI|nr:hypothetical protein [Lysinibacillus capsici]WGF37754.1 hypothetical protein QBO96_18865 [Lysinibacillus capsici]